VVKLESGRDGVVAAVLASAATQFDEFRFALATSPFQ